MVFPQVIAVLHALFDLVGLPGNLLVIITVVLVARFHVMRYILLASLAMSDVLFLILVNSFRIASLAQERWLYGETMCDLNPFFARYFYLNTTLHLIAVSFDRYEAIVKSPLTYDGTITKSSMAFIALIWLIPIPICIGPFLGRGNYVYNPEVFYCEQGWKTKRELNGWETTMVIAFLAVPLLVIIVLNLSVYKKAKVQINALAMQMGNLAGSEGQQEEDQEKQRRLSERKAAFDVIIIITAFLLSYLPTWIVGFCRQHIKSIEVSAPVILVTSSIVAVNSLCNPIIYSIRKREFRTAMKNLFRRIRRCLCPISEITEEHNWTNWILDSPHSQKMFKNLTWCLIKLTGARNITSCYCSQ